MKKPILFATLLVLLGASIVAVRLWRDQGPERKALPVVAITQIATHPALDEVREGIIAGLKARGFENGKNIEILFKNANGDASLALPIAQEFVRRSPAVIVPISTPSALSVAKATKTIPIVFSGVTDPVGVGLVKSLQTPGGNITGVSDRWPFRAQVSEFLALFPSARRIGMLYTRGDDVSRIGVEAMTSLSQSLGFQLRLVPVSEATDVYPSTVALLRDVDALYTGIDHLVLENLDPILKAAREAKKPVFGGESGSVEKGGVVALSINMARFGDQTAGLVAKVLRGALPGNLAIEVVSNGDLLINRRAAQSFGLSLAALRQRGARIIEGE